MISEKGGAMSSQPTMSEERVKTIEITLKKDGTPQVASGQDKVFLDSKKDEEVIWIAKFPFRIDFKNGTPFYEDQFNQNHRRSGLVRRGVLASRVRYYEYTIEVNGKTLDPKIMVFPGSD
jgi:hypothetical protein